jgi:hypothetical protein
MYNSHGSMSIVYLAIFCVVTFLVVGEKSALLSCHLSGTDRKYVLHPLEPDTLSPLFADVFFGAVGAFMSIQVFARVPPAASLHSISKATDVCHWLSKPSAHLAVLPLAGGEGRRSPCVLPIAGGVGTCHQQIVAPRRSDQQCPRTALRLCTPRLSDRMGGGAAVSRPPARYFPCRFPRSAASVRPSASGRSASSPSPPRHGALRTMCLTKYFRCERDKYVG